MMISIIIIITKHQDLVLEIQRLWNVKAEVIPIVIGALGAVTPELNDWLKKLPIKVRCDFAEVCSVEYCWDTSQNIEHL